MITAPRMVRFATAVALLAGVLTALPWEALGAQATTADSAALVVFRKAQRLVNDGQGAEGRALVDSMLNAAEPLSKEEAEALFWRATLAESWEAAQKDYLRIMLEHERSQRAGDAMLRLAQGEAARGDRDAAMRYLERLMREAPDSPARAEAGLWQGRLLLERGSRTPGCAALRSARPLLKPGSVELENQFDYLMRACPDSATLAAAEAAATESAKSAKSAPARTPPSAPPTTPVPAPATTPNRASTGPTWSVQVGALATSVEAEALAARMRDRGYEARVDSKSAPYRVRFGRFPTRAAATAAMDDYKQRERADAFVVEAPRG